MRPQRLELDGFGAFREPTTVEFNDIDLVALVGATGSGKSTIIDAITFALYGCVARYDNNLLVEPVISQTSTQARVRLDFELGGHAYTAVRVVRRTAQAATTREARLQRGDDVLAADARGMTRAVEALLGLDADQFNRTVVLPQGEFAAFLHDSPANRQKTLRHLLGFGMYARIGQAARQRAAAARNQVDALQPDLDKLESELTDDRRDALTATIQQIDEVRQRFATDVTAVESLTALISGLAARLAELDGQLALLAGVKMPGDATDIERRLTEATTSRDTAAVSLDNTRQRRLDAAAAVAAGPDLGRCREHLGRRHTASVLERERGDLTAELTETRTESETAVATAAAVIARQQELDSFAEQARLVDQQVRAAAAAGPNAAQIASWVQLRELRDASAIELAEAETDEATARAKLDPLDAALEAARTAEHAAGQDLRLVQERVGVAAHAGLLTVGDPCPLCLQEIHQLPAHHLDEELHRAKAAFEAASREAKEAASRRDGALDRVRLVAATATSQRQTLARCDEELGGVAPLEVLHEQRLEAKRLAVALANTADDSHESAAAATEHRNDPETIAAIATASAARDRVTALSSRLEDLTARTTAAQMALASVPPEAELTAAIAEAERLVEEQQQANEAFAKAESTHADANTALEVALRETRVAEQQLTSARDRVAVMSPPVRSAAGLVADWQALTSWAAERTTTLGDESVAVGADRAKVDADRAQLDTAARTRCATVLEIDAAHVALGRLGDELVAAGTHASVALQRFDEDRERLATLRQRVDGLREAAVVAEQLGHLLRADGFESWLMASALQGLVDAASVRLHELSGGQFSLVLDERSFAVRDHTNADEVRRARTLSGGETFLASLSLALALADATAELSPEGAPRIESIFLDEGFGTLDPQTLDTVATAIEELGAGGRMVAIVTHIRELADRMPVRFEVTKAANSSTVARVEA